MIIFSFKTFVISTLQKHLIKVKKRPKMIFFLGVCKRITIFAAVFNGKPHNKHI